MSNYEAVNLALTAMLVVLGILGLALKAFQAGRKK